MENWRELFVQNNRQVGGYYEKMAADYLVGQGMRILEMNYRCKVGEIDVIGQDGHYLVFVEVKYRKEGRHGGPLPAVDYKKQWRISKAAKFYLYSKKLGEETPCRFDVVGIEGQEITWIQNAFDYIE